MTVHSSNSEAAARIAQLSKANMHRLVPLSAFVLATVSLTAPPASGEVSRRGQQPPDSGSAKQVRAVDDARRVAMLHGDVAALDKILAEDATVYWGDGTADDKASTLALFQSGRLRYSRFDYHSTSVRIYGPTAVLTGMAHVQLESDGQAMAHVVRITRVYVRRAGRWQLVAVQTTRADPSASR